jgi:hypothetical protein
MAFTASSGKLLEVLEAYVATRLEDNWAAEPPAARAALLAREELRRFAAVTYPGSTSEGSALDPGSRRRLSLVIHSAPASHRVEIWGLGPDDDLAGAAATPHTPHSWVLVARAGGAGPAVDAVGDRLSSAGLRKVSERSGPRVALALWQGSGAPDGCPDCQKRP